MMKKIIKFILYCLFRPFIIKTGSVDGIYITFDDGPHPVNTPKILKVLDDANVKATFFMVGNEMEKFPEVVSLVNSSGHTIGYHSRNHYSLKKMSFKKMLSDFRYVKNLEDRFNIKIELYRPPFGDLTLLSFVLLIFYKLKVVMWSLDSGDSFYKKEHILSIVSKDNIKSGEILLFHDDYNLTVEILPEIIAEYEKNNYLCKAI